MGFLYGDSSACPLQGDFIEFLRETLDFCVRCLNADTRLTEQRERVATLQREGEATIGRLDKLAAAVATAVQHTTVEDMDAAVESCGASINRTAAELVRVEAARVKSTVVGEVSKLEAQATAIRVEVVKALEALLLRHDVPEAALRTHLRLLGGTRYGARLLATAPFGLEMVVDLDIPPNHLFATAVRVDKVVDRIEVLAPDPPGR